MNPDVSKRIRASFQKPANQNAPAEGGEENGAAGALMLSIGGIVQLIDTIAHAAETMTAHTDALNKQNELLTQQNHLLDMGNRIAAAPVLPQRVDGVIVSATKDLSGITGVSDDENDEAE